MPESKIKALRDIPRPMRKKQLRSFLGGIGYYRRYINGFASDSPELTPCHGQRCTGSDNVVRCYGDFF